LLHGECITMHRQTMAEELGRQYRMHRVADQDVISHRTDRCTARPSRDSQGQSRPEGCVAKITGLKNPAITGPARVFDSEPAVMDAIMAKKIQAGDVLVIRYEGPEGGPGMQEMLAPTSALIGQGLGESVGLITDGRFSGATGAWSSATSRPKRTMAAPSR
jgi:dihydroxy-acid dehydratase